MKKNLLSSLLMILGIALSASLVAQDLTWDDVIAEEKGDTVVVKGSKALAQTHPGAVNTIWVAVKGDTTETGERTNPNRVYETLVNEVYVTDGTLELDATVPMLKIVAQPVDRNGEDMPPLHIKQVQVDGSFDKTFFQTPGSMYISNQYILLALTNNTLDREVTRANGNDQRYEYDNCIFEFTNWVLHFPRAQNQTFKFTNCLFLNVGNEPTIEKGLVFDSWNSVDTLWFENNTILNAGGVVVGRSGDHVAPNFAYFNHNTIVNSALLPFSFFSQAEMIATNNIFVNAGMIPTFPGFYAFWEDEDQLPRGIINVDTVERAWIVDKWSYAGYPYMNADSTSNESMRKMLVDNNNAWWDTRIKEMELNAFPDTIDAEWDTQFLLMNSRTQAMFDDDEAYPYFYNGEWMEADPGFVNNQDLIPEWISFVQSNTNPGAPGGGDNMPWWRTNMTENIFLPDWPVLADLSYSDASMQTAATGGYPLGDLNWYPEDKASWEATNEAAALIAELKNPATSVNPEMSAMESGKLAAYPNPVSEYATLKFNISEKSNIDLAIYNILGEQVKLINLGYKTPGIHNFTLNRDDLNAGIYILRLSTGATTKISVK